MSGKKRFITLNLSDHTGFFEAIIFDDKVLKSYGDIVKIREIVVLRCNAYKSPTGHRFIIEKAQNLNDFFLEDNKEIQINLSNKKQLNSIIQYVAKLSAGKTKIRIQYPVNNTYYALISMKKSFQLSIDDINYLSQFKKQL